MSIIIIINIIIKTFIRYSSDAPTHDEIINEPTTAVPVPIYDTPMETDNSIIVHTNTAYQKLDVIDVHDNAAYGHITM